MILRSLAAVTAILLALGGAGTASLALEPASVALQPDGSDTIAIAIAAPLVLPPGNSGLLDETELAAYTQPGGTLDRQLAALESSPAVAIGIDPRIVASIRLLGRDAPADARSWLERLEATPNETFPLAWADADVLAPLQAGATQALQPVSLEFALDRSRFSPEPDPAATPTPTADPEALPNAADLTAWNYTLPRLAWPSSGSVAAGDIARLAENGFTSAIIGGVELAPGSARAGATIVTEGLVTAVADATISRHFDDAARAQTTADWSAATGRLSAALEELRASQSTVFVTAGRDWSDSGSRLGDTVAALVPQPWITQTTLSSVLRATPVAANLRAAEVDELRNARVAELLEAEALVVRFAVIVDDPVALISPRRLDLLALLSNAWRADESGWLVATQLYLDESTAVRSAVQIVDSSTINLLTDRGALPITVSNSLDQAVTVYITVRPQRAILSVDESRVELTIEPGANKRGSVPVTSLSNGEVAVNVYLYNASGAQIGERTQVEINVQAGWETAGTLVFAALVVGVFAFGLVRNIRKRRKLLHE